MPPARRIITAPSRQLIVPDRRLIVPRRKPRPIIDVMDLMPQRRVVASRSRFSGGILTGGGGSSEPTPSGTIVLDMRAGGAQDLQAAANFAAVQAYFTATGGELDPGGGPCTLSLDTNYNGAGKKALRIDWLTNAAESSDNGISFYFTSTPLRRICTSAILHLGKTASGGGVGSVGSFVPVTDGGGMKRMLWLRIHDQGADRMYWDWPEAGQASFTNGIEIDARSSGGSFLDDWSADYGVGQDVRWTWEFIPASTNTASDGVIRQWRNGVLTRENLAAQIGNTHFEQFQFIATRLNTTQNECEYWTDIALWGDP